MRPSPHLLYVFNQLNIPPSRILRGFSTAEQSLGISRSSTVTGSDFSTPLGSHP